MSTPDPNTCDTSGAPLPVAQSETPKLCPKCQGRKTFLDTTYDRTGVECDCDACCGTGFQVGTREELVKENAELRRGLTEPTMQNPMANTVKLYHSENLALRNEIDSLRDQLAAANATVAQWEKADRAGKHQEGILKERDEALSQLAAFTGKMECGHLRQFGTSGDVTPVTCLACKLAASQAALDQYRQGDEHAERDELVAATVHYREAERLRAIALSTPVPPNDELIDWPCQQLLGGTGEAIYANTEGRCKHPECHPSNDTRKQGEMQKLREERDNLKRWNEQAEKDQAASDKDMCEIQDSLGCPCEIPDAQTKTMERIRDLIAAEGELGDVRDELVFHKHRREAAYNVGKMGMPQGDCECSICHPFYAERSKLREELSAVTSERDEAKSWIETLKRLDKSTSPCGHNQQFAYSEDGVGKVIQCALCQVKARDSALTAEREKNIRLEKELALRG